MRTLLTLSFSLGLILPACSGDDGGGGTATDSSSGTDSGSTGTESTTGSTNPTSSTSESGSATGSSTTDATDSGSASDSDSAGTSTGTAGSSSTGTAGTTGAGTTGDGPSNAECEQFCMDYWDDCANSNDNDYPNPGGCVDACKGWDQAQYDCRVEHLGYVQDANDGHCGHAGLSGDGVCN